MEKFLFFVCNISKLIIKTFSLIWMSFLFIASHTDIFFLFGVGIKTVFVRYYKNGNVSFTLITNGYSSLSIMMNISYNINYINYNINIII